MSDVDNYLKNISPEQQAEFERIRKIVKGMVPDAGEKISYGIPTFTYKDTYLLYFGAFKDHMSVFPGSGSIDSLADRLEGFKLAKGTIQYTTAKLVPEDIIRELIAMRLAKIENR